MNVDAILKTADLVETDGRPFDMGDYRRCIMPRANEVGKIPPLDRWSGTARTALGLNEEQAHALFFSSGRDADEFISADRAKAARVLRHLAATGEVDWRIE